MTTSKYLYFFPVLCAGLGSWQLYRLQWKQNLIQSMNERLQSTIVTNLPQSADDYESLKSSIEHSRISVRGRFLHELEMLVGPRNKGGASRPGFYVYTPFLIEQSATSTSTLQSESSTQISDEGDGDQKKKNKVLVIVNRGWVPKSFADPGKRKGLHQSAMPDGIVNLFGMVRSPENYRPQKFRSAIEDRSIMNYYDGVSSSQWLWVDLPKMRDFIWDQIRYLHTHIPVSPSPNISSPNMASPNISSPNMEKKKVLEEMNIKIVDSYFVEEVLDPDSDDIISEEMKAWQKDLEDIESANSSLPTILANLKTVKMDPRSFHGKPIIGEATVQVPNKHLEYVYTWFSLSAILFLSIYLRRRRSNSIANTFIQSIKR
jgi:cytochrome oxidase assembly protein ShyY1